MTLDELAGMLSVRSAGERVWLTGTVAESLLADAVARLEKQLPQLRFATGEERNSPLQGKRRFVDVLARDKDDPEIREATSIE
ncbi:hypothetical protein [Caballeronia sp. ATUFL_M1_KS5A]|uniref:hypothetical protein n=1 Tax=Caballeronia sp. ATUFL_M1_KS5A TaxID=2921778 RepID=UPI00202986EA|nr:hypothetical protein [Caballeronia sp. ATUFL_M1_KS5A]